MRNVDEKHQWQQCFVFVRLMLSVTFSGINQHKLAHHCEVLSARQTFLQSRVVAQSTDCGG